MHNTHTTHKHRPIHKTHTNHITFIHNTHHTHMHILSHMLTQCIHTHMCYTCACTHRTHTLIRVCTKAHMHTCKCTLVTHTCMRRVPNETPQDVPLWHTGYFDLKIIKTQQIPKIFDLSFNYLKAFSWAVEAGSEKELLLGITF